MTKGELLWPVLMGAGIGGAVLYINATRNGRNNIQSIHGSFASLMSQGENQGNSTQSHNNKWNSAATSASIAQGQ